MRKEISIDRLKECFDLDPETGLLTWKWRSGVRDSINKRHAGKLAAMTPNDSGYRRVRVDGVRLLAHRVVFAMHHGYWPKGEIDHIDGDPGNNAIANLRECKHIENLRNCKKPISNTSGVTGVGFHKASGKYRATINDNGRHVHLGLFLSMEQAVEARDRAKNALQYTERHGN